MIWIQKKREPRELTEYRQLPHASYQDMHGAPTEKLLQMVPQRMFIRSSWTA